MRKFRDIDQVRQDIKTKIPLSEFIELVDGKQLERVNDDLYKKRCDLDDHPMDPDGTRDSTASFTVCPSKELWYCFGCGSGGDRIEYVSKKLHLDHIESIYKCAEIEGLDLTHYYEDVTDADKVEESLFNDNNTARDIAHQMLLSRQDKLDYLLGRGISMESIEEFKIGYAPELNGNDKITMFESIPNYKALHLDRKDQLIDAILFPVCDTYGRMRYFQSRPFHPMTAMKYIGGSDTHPLYNESDRIYGFCTARKGLRKSKGLMIGVEGAPDAIVCNQHGIPTIGFLGTAVNQNTFAILDKFRVKELVLLLDGDKAGYDRSNKIAEKYLSIQTNVILKIAKMPEGDPDEFLNKYGADELWKVINSAPLAIQYLIDIKYSEINPITPTGKIEFIGAVQQYMNAVNNKLVKKILIQHIAGKIGFDPVEIEDYYMASSVNQEGVSLYSPDGEETLLGEALRNPDYAAELATTFQSSDWYLARNRALFDIIKSTKYSDPESVLTIAKNKGIDNLITRDWLERLVYNVGNVEFCMSDVVDKLTRRKAKEMIGRLNEELNDMSKVPQVMIDQSMGQIYSVVTRGNDEMVYSAKQQVSSVMALIHERMKDPGKIIGFNLGPKFEKLTRALLGIQTKTLTTIAANQSVGKTQLGENWALYQAVEEQLGVLWISLEMDSDRMTFRNLSILSGIPLTPLLTGNITVDQKMKVLDPWAVKLEQSPLFISERGHELSESLAIARRYVMKEKVKIVYVDYIQLQYVSGIGNRQRYQELGLISKAWKQFSKEMDVAVVCISQLSKEALNAEIAKAEHGAGSYEVAQDSDNYVTLKEKAQEEIDQRGIEKGNLTMNLDKNRMGQADILIDIFSDRSTQRMCEVE